jgi:hypothetical protein
VHYEKIKRICTYCAKLFHNAEQCPDRAQSILVAGEDQGFDRFGHWMTQANRILMQLVENQLTAYQDVVPGPSSALQELRQAFAGVRMGTSMVQPPRPLHMPQEIPSHTSAVVTSGIPVTTSTDDMILDNLALVPVTTHQTEAEIFQSLQNQLQQIVPISISHGTPQTGQNQQQQITPAQFISILSQLMHPLGSRINLLTTPVPRLPHPNRLCSNSLSIIFNKLKFRFRSLLKLTHILLYPLNARLNQPLVLTMSHYH